MTIKEQLTRILRPHFPGPEFGTVLNFALEHAEKRAVDPRDHKTILSCARDAITLFFVEVEGLTFEEATQLNHL